MKKEFLVLLALFSFMIGHTQEFTPMKSPEVTSFVNANYLPIDESTGKTNITIPLYTINLDGMNIPISLSYDTGGVKVDATASNVGLNWTLNASGVVNKEIMGQEDIYVKGALNDNSPTGFVYTGYGYLRHLLNFTYDPGHPVSEPFRDNQPDLFYVMAPGINTKFTHKKDGTPIEISNTATLIKSPFNDPEFLVNPYWRFSLKPSFKFELTPTNGFTYTFSDIGLHYFNVKNYSNEILDFGFDPLPINTTLENFTDLVFPYAQYTGSLANVPDLFPTVHLSSIQNPISKRSIEYLYEENTIVDNNRRIEKTYSSPDVTRVSSTVYTTDFTVEKLLSKIIFPEGIVDFYYDANRLDIRGGKILKKIEVRNNLGELIKGIAFEQDYFKSVENCNDNYCYRLRLNAIKFFDKDKNVLPGYTFKYNTTKLPKRFSVAQDFNGYYNNQTGTIPKIYYKVNQGRNSHIPFPYAGYSLVPGGNLDKTPNLVYSKAASLEKITYPTGGSTVFDYELHSFKFLNSTIQSGGLRLSSQSMYDTDNTLQRKITYTYELEGGATSGGLTNLPNYITSYQPSINTKTISQTVNSKLELTKGSYVTYSKVKIKEENNGYVINQYSNAIDSPNEYPATFNYGGLPTLYDFETLFNNGVYQGIYRDFSTKRGLLISSNIYDEQDNLLKTTVNDYEYIEYDSFPINQITITRPPNWSFSIGNNAGYVNFNSSVALESSLLKKSTTKDYTKNGDFSKEQSYTYDANKPLVKETTTITNGNETESEVVFYPFDTEVSSLPNINKLVSLNKLTPIKRQYFTNNELLATSLTSFDDFGANKILPTTISEAKENDPLEVKINFQEYDHRGNLIAYKKESGMSIAVLWGYNYQYKIAEILNATYAEVLQALNTNDIKVLQRLTNTELEVKLNTLRDNLPNAQVYSYIHIPSVGVQSITNPSGLKSTYIYDSFKRLVTVKDDEGKVVSSNEYHYKQQVDTALPTEKPLVAKVVKSVSPEYVANPSPNIQETVLSAMTKGGNGDYKYEWRISGSSIVVGREYKYTVAVPCGTSTIYEIKVIDTNGNTITENVEVKAPVCGEAFFAGVIEGYSAADNQNNFWINVEGGSYSGTYRYDWFIPGGPPVVDAGSYDNKYPGGTLLKNTSGNPVTVDLHVRVTDIETGYSVTRNRQVTIQPAFEINSCFVAGTKITMSDGSQKNIEDVTIGDIVLTYNIDKKDVEEGKVENIVSPMHDKLVTLTFKDGIQNINTHDHPYYIKDKGWASYNPNMTKANYDLDVKKIEIGDITLLYDETTKKVKELELLKLEEILKAQKTYNLDKVSKNHNFFANGILVHNKSNGKKRISENKYGYKN